MPRYVVMHDGKLTRNDAPCAKGSIIDLPAEIAVMYGLDLVRPVEESASTPVPIVSPHEALKMEKKQ